MQIRSARSGLIWWPLIVVMYKKAEMLLVSVGFVALHSGVLFAWSFAAFVICIIL